MLRLEVAETGRGVTLHFVDGSLARGHLLIGADGLMSVMRHQIGCEVPASYTGDAAWRITVRVELMPKIFIGQVMLIFIEPSGYVVCYYVPCRHAVEIDRSRRDRRGHAVSENASDWAVRVS